MANKQNWERNTFEQRKQRYKELPIVEVAESLGIGLKKTGQSYISAEHDSLVFRPNKNDFFWNSKNIGGDTIKFVEVYLNCSFKEAMNWFDQQVFSDGIAKPKTEVVRPTFNYMLKDFPINEGKSFLMNVRKLSSDTIEYFVKQGVISETNRYYKGDGFTERVLSFKSFDGNGRLVGATLQGIKPYPERPTHFKGYLKEIVYASDGERGVRIQTSAHPRKFVFSESTIDLMSYYELYKSELQDAVLVSMNGLKQSVIHSAFKDTYGVDSPLNAHDYFNDLCQRINAETAREKGFQIILAVDNDEGGNRFIQNTEIINIPVYIHQPILNDGEQKKDWNEVIQKGEKLQQEKPISKLEWQMKHLAKEISDTIIQNKTIIRNENQPEIRLRNFHLGLDNETLIFQIKKENKIAFRLPLTLKENQISFDESKKTTLITSQDFPEAFIVSFINEINRRSFHPILVNQRQKQRNLVSKRQWSIDKDKLIKQVKNLPNVLQDSNNLKSFLDLMARFPDLSANNLALLYVQKPNASVVATKDEWIAQHHPVSNQVAPIILLNQGSTDENVPQKMRFVFDIGDIAHSPEVTKNKKVTEMTEATFKNIFLSIIRSTDFKIGYEILSPEQKGYIDSENKRIILNKNLFQNVNHKYSSVIQDIMLLVQETRTPTNLREEFHNNHNILNVFHQSIVYTAMVHLGVDCTLGKELCFDKCTSEQVKIFMKNFSIIQQQTQELIQKIDTFLTQQKEHTRPINPIRAEILNVRRSMAEEKKQEPPSFEQQINYNKGRVYNENRN